ncbi:F-box protein [Phytophthora citrophthora]|uniref:F-box protein n=1 Tax=Phytophthora citrophthora TaxID=4793 RepID=A0AAD9G327_9STRA|nr:F-box protein [Phytophthora citrophthora]
MKDLKRFRSDPSVNILLLSKSGAYGLDLTNVTHIFLLEEQQVISRAYLVGANHSVTVEKLWMKGSVESQLTSMIDDEEEKLCVDDLDEPPTREEVLEASSTNKESFPGMKVEFLLRNMHFLDEAPQDNKLRFTVFTEGADKEKIAVRRGVVTIADSDGAPSITPLDGPDITGE